MRLSKDLSLPFRLQASREVWLDIAKGISILLVLVMHSTLSVGEELASTGFMHDFVVFTKPFRMPDFFLISGLLAARTISRGWLWFVDRKLVHFAYFYLLWLLILLSAKAPALGIVEPGAFLNAYLQALVEPFATLWFIFVLPFFFLALRLTARVPVWLALGFAGSLHVVAAMSPEGGAYAMASRLTGWFAVDSFCLFLVYFLLGARLSEHWMRILTWLAERPVRLPITIVGWLMFHALGLRMGFTEIPGLTLLFGLAGAIAVTAMSMALAQLGSFGWLAAIGRQSLAIYVAFLVPMAISRHILIGYAGFSHAGWVALAVFAFSTLACLILAQIAPRIGLGFLFVRPDWARFSPPR